MATTVNTIYPAQNLEPRTNTAGGVNLGNAVSITNKASGGAIGTAAATVDVGSIFLVNQTTASQTLTLPSPTITTEYKLIVVANVGSQAFTMLGMSLGAGTSLAAIWTGAAWSLITGLDVS